MSAFEELKLDWRDAAEEGVGLWLYLWPVLLLLATVEMLTSHRFHGRDRDSLIFCTVMFFVGLANGWLLRGRR